MELVKVVDEEGIPIKEAAARLNINYSTAKHIIKYFKKNGIVETKQMLKRKLGPSRIHKLE